MPKLVDLICPDKHFESDVFLPHIDAAHTPCPVLVKAPGRWAGLVACGKPRTVSYISGESAAVKLFTPFYHDGVGMINDQGEWDRLRNKLAKVHGCSPDAFVMARDSKTEARTLADEHRHRAYVRNKKNGLDSARVNEIKDTSRRYGFNPHSGKVAKRRPTKVP